MISHMIRIAFPASHAPQLPHRIPDGGVLGKSRDADALPLICSQGSPRDRRRSLRPKWRWSVGGGPHGTYFTPDTAIKPPGPTSVSKHAAPTLRQLHMPLESADNYLGWRLAASSPPCVTFRLVVVPYGALDSHPFFPLHVASGRCFLSAAAAGALAGVVSAFAEPSSWCVRAVLNVTWCAVCASAAPNSWRIEDVLVVAGVV